MKPQLLFIKTYFKILDRIDSKKAGDIAFDFMQKTQRLPFKKKEIAFYNTAHHFSAPSELGDIQCYEIGDPAGAPVILVHGWESNAGSMSGIGNVLAYQGYHVISFDLPAHGHSKHRKTNLKECTLALEAVIRRVNPAVPISIVTHSFGSAVATHTLSRNPIAIDRFIILTSPNDFSEFIEPFSRLVGFSKPALNQIISNAEYLFDEPFSSLQVNHKMKDVFPNRRGIIHDKFDRVIPFKNSEMLASNHPDTELVALEKTGHYRMLWNDVVHDQIKIWFSPTPDSSLNLHVHT